MDIGGVDYSTMEIPYFLGLNNAQSFSEIDIKESRDMLNGLPNSIGSIAKRPGTIPLTNNAHTGPLKRIFDLRREGQQYILVTNGNTLYRYDNGSLTAQQMTNSLVTDDVGESQFKDENGNEVLVLADGGDLKAYDGTAVYNIPPADDTDDVNNGRPANDLATINTDHPPIGTTVHNTRVVIWDGSDTIHHSKVGFYDYFPTVNYQRFVKENDFVQTCTTYAGNLIVFMRRHIGVLFGDGYTGSSGDWSQDFLDTRDGCINPNTVANVTFPNGKQELFYLSDDGVHSVYTIDTIFMDNSNFYSTKSMTSEKIDWESLGVTVDEWKQARGYFHDKKYWLIYPKGTEWHGLVYDTLSESWYPIDNIDAHDFYEDEDNVYLACDNGHIKTLDRDLYSDWDDKAKTTGTPIEFYWYSKLINPKLTGLPHLWDDMMIEARQFKTKSSIDIEAYTRTGTYSKPSGIKTAQLIWGETEWGETQWSNPKLTDVVNEAKRQRIVLKGQYLQTKLSNNRDEPVEIFSLKYEVRIMRK